MPRIGLVIEGKHDAIMLPPLIRGELSSRGITDVSLEVIHPLADETGTIESGGWVRVKAWCTANGGRNIETFFEPLFARQPALDAIVFHLDGDCLHHACRSSSVTMPSLPVTPTQRVIHISDALDEWLSIPKPHRHKMVFAIPVQSTEAWILAAEAVYHDVETMDAKSEFRRTFSKERDGDLSKFYRFRADAAFSRTSQIANQCLSFAKFRDDLSEAITP